MFRIRGNSCPGVSLENTSLGAQSPFSGLAVSRDPGQLFHAAAAQGVILCKKTQFKFLCANLIMLPDPLPWCIDLGGTLRSAPLTDLWVKPKACWLDTQYSIGKAAQNRKPLQTQVLSYRPKSTLWTYVSTNCQATLRCLSIALRSAKT